MTESDWWACQEPQRMLEFLRDSGRASERQLQLFSIACVRRVWRLLQGEYEVYLCHSVVAKERFVDRELSSEVLAAIIARLDRHPTTWASADWDLNHATIPGMAPYVALEFAVLAAEHAIREPVNAMLSARYAAFAEATASFIRQGPEYAALHLADHVARFGLAAATIYAATFRRGADLVQKLVLTKNGWEREMETEVEPANGYAVLAAIADAERVQSNLVRDLFGNPCCPPLALTPSLLVWNNGLVIDLAQAAYDERALPSGHLDLVRLAVLCDALTDAGCPEDHELLVHLRGPGPHVRGCFALDLVTGRE